MHLMHLMKHLQKLFLTCFCVMITHRNIHVEIIQLHVSNSKLPGVEGIVDDPYLYGPKQIMLLTPLKAIYGSGT